MTNALHIIRQLVADFKANEQAFLSPAYQESQVRQDFIDKFFAALGWDVTHVQQRNPYEQEVHIENKVSMQGSPKGAGQRRADYAFFLHPNYRDPKFFVEAKKPSRNLANADDYYQTIRYGWNANTPLAVLTDFEEFHILDCRYKPDIKDALSHKVESFHYSEYANEEKFSRIYWLFSREAVANGSIEKRAAELKKPRWGGPRGKEVQRGMFRGGYQSVDEAFLEELDSYRETLAKAFKKENPTLGSEELTEAVQRTIDRLVFIRFLEDKQIEEREVVNLRSRASAWKAFVALCKRLEPKYNGLIFKPHKILDGKEFRAPDDTEFANICDELADPRSPYNFDQIPISILGSIYERFLGKVVHATDKRVKVEEKPEVRKAGGVYYTPQYIVRYIVNETVGKLLYNELSFPNSSIGNPESENNKGLDARSQSAGMTKKEREWKTPKEIAAMSFADIACGSGSFLIEVYAQLLEYHLRYYAANPAKRTEADVFERDGKLHLTLKKKKEILTNNVYGVDIDFQATEVTQLSLYLKLLEDVTMHDAHQFGMFKETILPDLRSNIVCGNSLIGMDIKGLFASDTSSPHSREEVSQRDGLPAASKAGGVDYLKPMDFENVFPEIFKKGGPSAGSGQGFDAVVGNPPYVSSKELESWQKEYFRASFDTAREQFDLYTIFIERGMTLLVTGGRFGYIIPDAILDRSSASELRHYLLKHVRLESIVQLNGVFDDPNVSNIVLTFVKEKSSNSHIVSFKKCKDGEEFKSGGGFEVGVYQKNYGKIRNNSFIFASDKEFDLIDKILQSGTSLGSQSRMGRGEEIGKKAGVVSGSKQTDGQSIIFGEDVQRYSIRATSKFISRRNVRKESWIYGKKIVVRQLGEKINASLDNTGLVTLQSIYSVLPNSDLSEKYLLAILNSRLTDFIYSKLFKSKELFPRILLESLRELPIRTINFSDPTDKARHDHIVSLVEQMLEAKEKLQRAKTDAETNRLELQCESLDCQIDEAVYELYELTEEEKKVVEGK